MTAKDLSKIKERGHARRRNLKRYLSTHSFTRVSGMDYGVDGSLDPEQERAISLLSVISVAVIGLGLFFMIF